MQADMNLRHVVVDGSNIATEGRDTPSLSQLDEAVQAFIREFEPELVTVVVDATFPNRIHRKERKVYEEAITAGELITPPAGAIGRGDAFVLQIADRAGATVLSNDSFQEFHGEYAWLFDKGRLVGGKPVPHVGWVFMDRAPVRGPASRRAVSAARRVQDRAATRAEKATRQEAAPTASGSTPASAGGSASSSAPTASGSAASGAAPPAKASERASAPKKRRRSSKAAEPVAAPAAAVAPAAAAAEAPESEPVPSVADAPDATATPAYNEPGPFGGFLSEHDVGSDVQAVVESFGSHGAYLRFGSLRAYAPLKNLGDPVPRSAKEALKVGETRTFVVAEIDRARRGVDLALAGTPVAVTAAASRPAAKPKAKAAKAAKTKPAKAAKTKPAKATSPEQAAGSGQEPRSEKAAKPAGSGRQSESGKAAKPAGSGRQSESGKAAKPSGRDGPAKQGKPAKQAAKRGQPAKSEKPAKKAGRSAKKAAAKAPSNPNR
jgi:Zc3h12a-like ribonuclease protein